MNFIIISLFSSVFLVEVFAQNVPNFESVIDRFDASQIDPKCVAQIENIQKFDKSGLVLLKMLDASSKIPSGMLEINYGEVGNFDECIQIEENFVLGKYCLGQLRINPEGREIYKNTSLLRTFDASMSLKQNFISLLNDDKLKIISLYSPTLAFCVPDQCSPGEFVEVFKTYYHLSGFDIDFPDIFCQTKIDTSPPLTTAPIVTISIFALLILIMILSTVYDIYCNQNGTEAKHELFIAFSAYTNCKKLFKMSSNNVEQLNCYNGIRFLSMVWIIAGHNLSVRLAGPVSNILDVINFLDHPVSMLIVNGILAVDTFFVIGSSLLVYNFLKAKDNGKQINLFHFYIHRLLRLTPAFYAVILVSSTVIEYMGTGPKWPILAKFFQKNCEKYWWSAMIFVQNYINVSEMCVGHAWYLDIDMQLYILSPILLFLIWKHPKWGAYTIGGIVSILVGVSFYVAWINHLPALLTNVNERKSNSDYMNKYYLLTHTRAGPWLIGALLGFFIFHIKRGAIKMNFDKHIIFAFWMVWCGVVCTIIFPAHSTLRGEEFDKFGNAFYIALISPAWSVCVSLLILACITNNAGPINWILSLKIFQVLSRFTYSMYLLHVTFLYMIVYWSKVAFYFSIFNYAYSFWGIYMFSFALSIFWVLAFESPVIVIEKILFGSAKK